MDLSDYANLPAAKPPPGTKSNFDNPQSREVDAYIGIWICFGITLLFVLLRLYVKLIITHKWAWDDCELSTMIIFLDAHDNRGLPVGIRKAFVLLVILAL